VKFLKQDRRARPKISLILVDWSVRESFQLLHYLGKQNVERNSFEVIVIEYYSRAADAIRQLENQVDIWLLLEMPESCYYHKHLMYNAGILAANGEICVICDSDAMAKEGFIRAIITQFENDPGIVLHLDQFRNSRRDFYPFCYPTFEEVAGRGCINNIGGKPRGIIDDTDPIHIRNYGACMCAPRADLIAIGGADEHIDYLGHICGPYEMTFRLVNLGRREIWHESEFIYHTWHPGQAGADNYLGPHDGKQMSTTALAALSSRRVTPLVQNQAIKALRAGESTRDEALYAQLLRREDKQLWNRADLDNVANRAWFTAAVALVGNYKGFALYREGEIFFAHLLLDDHHARKETWRYRIYFEASSTVEIRRQIDEWTPGLVNLLIGMGQGFVTAWQACHYAFRMIGKLSAQLVTRTR
jgi:hypothetical protein